VRTSGDLRSKRRQREINVLRYVPGSSPAHGVWAGTKLLCALALGIATFAKPEWTTIGVVAAVVALFALSARLPRGVFGHPPWWILIGLGSGLVLAFLNFGKPNVHVLGSTIGLGGLLDYLRFTSIGLELIAGGLLIGWTTKLADIALAVDRLAAPARLLRLPVDEVVLAIGLSVRCLPLITSDVTVLRAAWRVRAPVVHMSFTDRVQEIRDLLVAVIVSALRRAREMADAIDARGGPRSPYRYARVRLSLSDAVAFAVVAGALALIVLL
jgi:energy-coupling factor transporter transmembrane protein EcfT